uniref:Importin-beta domain, armadillo-type fold protein n=1 Tax=Tanacetum cinerariifolium TaxID=118510 RepID=A0A6L2NBB7_TANCI|nr:importin-beta domain, armadillo-type fold protein [Tanacetum cinerariifolium]
MTKVIKEEFKKLGLLEIDDDLFTYDTQLGMIFIEFFRLSRINDDLFNYEIKVPKPTICVEQRTSDLTHNDLEDYEWKRNYEECEKIYAEVVMFVNKRLIRLIDVTMEQWLNLKYGDHKTMDKNVKKGVIGTGNLELQVGWGSGQEANPTDSGQVVGRRWGKRVL